jgi:predicted acyl esterase
MSNFGARIAVMVLVAMAFPALSEVVLTNETPANFVPKVESFDYTKREEMIPMRDGVKLKTVILVPRGASRAPILLSRTPYGATSRIAKSVSSHLTALIGDSDAATGSSRTFRRPTARWAFWEFPTMDSPR